jgi:hypothetical protein
MLALRDSPALKFTIVYVWNRFGKVPFCPAFLIRARMKPPDVIPSSSV